KPIMGQFESLTQHVTDRETQTDPLPDQRRTGLLGRGVLKMAARDVWSLKLGCMKLSKILDRLEKAYGKAAERGPKDAYEMLLHRNCGYPQSHERCDNGFRALKEQVGLSPTEILAASDARLAKVFRESKSGMVPEKRAQRLKEVAAMVQMKHGGKLRE